jgi:hypothetical protein
MANRKGYDGRNMQAEVWDIVGQFAVDGGSLVTAGSTKPNGSILSVARTGVGVYLVTLVDSWPDILYASADIVAPGTVAFFAVPSTITPGNPSSVEFTMKANGTGAPADITSKTVVFCISCKNSTAVP